MVPVLRALKADEAFESLLCLTGQHQELDRIVLSDFSVVSDYVLPCRRGDGSLTTLTSVLIRDIGELIGQARPDRVLVQGDTHSTVAGAIAAYFRRVPVAHIEAGLRTGDLDAPWPEEGNRRTVAVYADLHFAPTEGARENLLNEGIPGDRIIVTGNTIIDMVRLAQGLGAGRRGPLPAFSEAATPGRKRILVTCHRRENWERAVDNLCDAGCLLARDSGAEICFVVHPNPALAQRVRRRLKAAKTIRVLHPLPYLEFIALMEHSDLVVTDSGGLQEEAVALGKHIVVVRRKTERPEGIETGYAELAGTETGAIVEAVHRNLGKPPPLEGLDTPFGDGRATGRILEQLRRRHSRC